MASASTHYSVLLRRFTEKSATPTFCYYFSAHRNCIWFFLLEIGILYEGSNPAWFSFAFLSISLKWVTLSLTAQALRVMPFVCLMVSLVFTMPIVEL